MFLFVLDRVCPNMKALVPIHVVGLQKNIEPKMFFIFFTGEKIMYFFHFFVNFL